MVHNKKLYRLAVEVSIRTGKERRKPLITHCVLTKP